MSANPFALWADLWSAGLKAAANNVRAGEMLVDSANVIAKRMPVIAAACRDPAGADLAELGRMVTEKQEAARDAGLAVAGDLTRLQRDLFRQWTDWRALPRASRRARPGSARSPPARRRCSARSPARPKRPPGRSTGAPAPM